MINRMNVRALSCLLLTEALSGTMPVAGASLIAPRGIMALVMQQPAPLQPGTPVPQDVVAAPLQTPQPLASPAPAKHHLKPWVWAVIAAGVGAGIGAGVMAGNSHSSSAASTTSAITITQGSGGATPGAPH